MQVNWPKLNTPVWASEAYYNSLDRVAKDPLMGAFLPHHNRGRSGSMVGYMEEGKKRIE